MIEERPAHAVELVDDPCVLVLDALDLGGELRSRLVRGREPSLRGALLLRGAQPLELAAERGSGALGVGAGLRFLFEQRPLLERDTTRLLGGTQVAARQRFDLDQALAGAAPARDRGGIDRRGLDREHGRRRQGRARPLREHLVEQQLARATGLGGSEIRGRDRVSGRGHPFDSSASDPSTLDHSA